MSANITQPRRATKWLLQGNAWLVYLFFYAPIAVLLIFSFSDDRNVGVWGGFTFDWYREVANSEPTKDALWNSIQIAVVSTLVSVVLGTMAALALERFTFRGRKVFDALLYLPIIIPDVTMAVMMLLFFSEFFDLINSV